MVTVPAVTPVTNPVPDTVAFALLALHVPPGTASDNVIIVPAHTVDSPVIGAAPVAGSTVTICVALFVPQPLVTE